MPKSRVGRLLFAVAALFLSFIIGRNLYRKHANSALIASIQTANASAVRSLLARGADPNCRASGAKSPPALSLAMSMLDNGKPDALVLSDKPINTAPAGVTVALTRANQFSQNEESIARLLIEKGADVRSPEQVKYGYLTTACIKGNLAVLRSLLEHGADPQAASSPYSNAVGTALNYAITSSYSGPGGAIYGISAAEPNAKKMEADYRREVSRQMVQLLREHGARLTLTQAVQINDMTALKKLLDAGNSPDPQIPDEEPALCEAVQRDNNAAVKLLLDHKADANAHRRYDVTALTIAAGKGNIALMQRLLAHGADVNAKPRRGHTALYYARKHKHADITALLQQAGGRDE